MYKGDVNAERPPAGGGQRCARYLGLVFSTTECGAAAAAEDGAEAYVSLPMRGAVGWHGCPAFELGAVPEMVLALLDELAAAGWDLSAPGWLSQAWRQHDLALIDADGQPLLPALSWQCNGAQAESALLNGLPGFRSAVGAVEARFIAAKLPWALAREPRLRGRLAAVMTSGDWFAGRLTGNRFRLSSSDALSNGLLDQQTKQLATVPLRQANDRLGDRLQPAWFPPVVASNGAVGTIEAAAAAPWRPLGERLRGWRVAALLGDNHASAAGCGAAEYDTMVLSLGTSGTVNLPAPSSAQPSGDILAFEYWDDRLFLLMLAQCGAWYERFRAELNRRGLARRALAGGGLAQGGPAQGGPAQGVPASPEQQPGEAAGEQAAGEHAGDAPQRDARKRDAVERNARMWGEWQPTLGYDELNRLAVACDPERIVRLPQPPAGIDGAGEAARTAAADPGDCARAEGANVEKGAGHGWPELNGLDLAAQVASTQASIALEMLDRVRAMLAAASEPIRTFVLTGGLSRATLVREVLYTGLRQLAERDPRVAADARVLLNDRSGPLAYKTDALGALLNARIAASGQSPRVVIAADRRWRPCPVPPPDRMRRLQHLLR